MTHLAGSEMTLDSQLTYMFLFQELAAGNAEI
jgi:hypothetical protein